MNMIVGEEFDPVNWSDWSDEDVEAMTAMELREVEYLERVGNNFSDEEA